MNKKERRAMRLEARSMFQQFLRAGIEAEQMLKKAVNEMPFWRRIPAAFKILIGRW